MASKFVVNLLNPWKAKREREAERLAELRARDGDACARCRRPMQFDRPPGHELAAKIERISNGPPAGGDLLANLCLTHGRCNATGVDLTVEVAERVRRKSEAARPARVRRKRAA